MITDEKFFVVNNDRASSLVRDERYSCDVFSRPAPNELTKADKQTNFSHQPSPCTQLRVKSSSRSSAKSALKQEFTDHVFGGRNATPAILVEAVLYVVFLKLFGQVT